MSSVQNEPATHCKDLGQTNVCRLCGEFCTACVELADVHPSISPSFISRHMGIKLKRKPSCLICQQCIEKIQQWKEFVTSCVNAQSTINSKDVPKDVATCDETVNVTKETVPPESAEVPDVPVVHDQETENKKSKFTVEYLAEKLGRELSEEETEKLTKLIDKGDNRAIYGFLLGRGANQTWPCQFCSTVIKGTMKQVAQHYASEHQAEPLYPCQLCGKVIKSSHTFKRHRTAHFAEYKCPSCDKVFQDRSRLLSHQLVHSDSRPHQCAECGMQFKEAKQLKAHVARSHIPEADRLSHTCEICGKRFASKGSLTTHVQRTHAETRPFICELCGKGLKSKQTLQFHMNSHSGVKHFACHICSLSFTSRASMASHIRRHTGERPYPCKHCGKTFISSSARSKHALKVHTTSRKHSCPHCEKSFKALRDLNVHLSVHTGEKAYMCDVCGKAFRVAANFYAHRKRHRKTSASPEELTATTTSEDG